MRTLRQVLWLTALVVLMLAGRPALAGDSPRAAAEVARAEMDPLQVRWEPQVEFERLVLTVSTPGGTVVRREFTAGQTPVFDLAREGAVDGSYNWELRVVPHVDPGMRRQLAAAHQRGEMSAQLRVAGPTVQSGSFVIADGTVVRQDVPEERAPRVQTSRQVNNITAADQVIPDDLIVQGSACVGLDCVNNESFGFDTIRMKENNTRIKFEDTSVGSFPTNDWQLTANDSASGASSKFSIEDITGSKVPFTVTAGAATNSIFVDSTGRLGLRTSTPVLDLHINTSNTPAIRLEQNNSGGFTAQTWDIAGNEANFFVRDVTGGSRLPFRIRPGAPTSSIDISASGDVGIGTASASKKLTVKNDTANDTVFQIQNSTVSNTVIFSIFETTAGAGLFSLLNESGAEQVRNSGSGGHSWTSGTYGINCNSSGGFDFAIKSGTTSTTACNTNTFSGINAGQTTFTIASSRSIKTDIQPVQVPNILDKIKGVDVYTYNYIDGPKDRLGLMAEDFHQVFGRGSDKMLNGQEVEMALWLAVKELTKQNEALTQRLTELEAKQQKQQP